MEIKSNESAGITIVYLSGQLNGATAGQAYDELVRVAQSGTKKVILNLRNLTYVASAGLRSILVAAKLLKTARGEMCFCEANKNVKDVLETSGFDNLIRLYADEGEAVASFAT